MTSMTLLFITGALLAGEHLVDPDVDTRPALRIENAWVREAPPGVEVLAAYGRFCNDAEKTVTLTAIDSVDFDAVEMHETVEDGDAVSMLPLADVTIDAADCVVFAPGGRHLMLLHPKRPMRAGDEVVFTLRLDNGRQMASIVPVRRADEMINHEHEHH